MPETPGAVETMIFFDNRIVGAAKNHGSWKGDLNERDFPEPLAERPARQRPARKRSGAIFRGWNAPASLKPIIPIST